MFHVFFYLKKDNIKTCILIDFWFIIFFSGKMFLNMAGLNHGFSLKKEEETRFKGDGKWDFSL